MSDNDQKNRVSASIRKYFRDRKMTSKDPKIMGGVECFNRTRVPLADLVQYVKQNND